jgi:hypothetical protein
MRAAALAANRYGANVSVPCVEEAVGALKPDHDGAIDIHIPGSGSILELAGPHPQRVIGLILACCRLGGATRGGTRGERLGEDMRERVDALPRAGHVIAIGLRSLPSPEVAGRSPIAQHDDGDHDLPPSRIVLTLLRFRVSRSCIVRAVGATAARASPWVAARS